MFMNQGLLQILSKLSRYILARYLIRFLINEYKMNDKAKQC